MNFDAFLDDIFLGNASSRDAMQRLVGYASTGDMTESLIVVCWGAGRNGKSTFFNALRPAMSRDLCFTSLSSDFGWDGRPNPHVLSLRGVRLAVFEGVDSTLSKSAIARLKSLSSGDTVTAREPFSHNCTEFRPIATPFLETSAPSKFAVYGEAFRQRCALVEFPAVFTSTPNGDGQLKAIPAHSLLQDLRQDVDAIRAWIDRGADLYRAEGLVLPERCRPVLRKRGGRAA